MQQLPRLERQAKHTLHRRQFSIDLAIRCALLLAIAVNDIDASERLVNQPFLSSRGDDS
jgi:hypothetical protein